MARLKLYYGAYGENLLILRSARASCGLAWRSLHDCRFAKSSSLDLDASACNMDDALITNGDAHARSVRRDILQEGVSDQA